MVKGCERRVVVYKSNGSKYFCEAHFFIKPTLDMKIVRRADMLEEANRIIRESELCRAPKQKKRTRALVFRVILFLFGCALSSAVTLLISSNL